MPTPRRLIDLLTALGTVVALAAGCTTAAEPAAQVVATHAPPAQPDQVPADPGTEPEQRTATTSSTTAPRAGSGGGSSDDPRGSGGTSGTDGSDGAGGAGGAGGSPGGVGTPEAGAIARGSAECQELAQGPWAEVELRGDPLAAIRAGRASTVASTPGGLPLDDITELPTVDDYRDPSTIEDPERLRAAWSELGYQGGIEARFEDGSLLVVVGAVRFADAARAREALTAFLEDYCSRAVGAQVRRARNGLLVFRDRGASRAVFVTGEVVISTFVCSCLSGETDLEAWSTEVERELSRDTAE